ncbi:hypothetical protein CVT26_010658 [Gymnopilus dilepis]|uniref:Uncharacterized protein n=1 Tax=Gymnopilus dilepis TaxID=231916 RepID=A0A409VIB7_9AGAR|nr:hypothetical protein CVT26_010658 [Gymnopilus dilepis]
MDDSSRRTSVDESRAEFMGYIAPPSLTRTETAQGANSGSASARLPGQPTGISISSPLVYLSSPLPAIIPSSIQSAPSNAPSRKRGRPPLTRENQPTFEDSQVLISLGMSPFMPGQDVMYNQNRFVRNEAILARHVSSLQRRYAQLESHHSRLFDDIHRILREHKTQIERLSISPGKEEQERDALRLPEAELLIVQRRYDDLREVVRSILHYISSPSSSSRGGLERLQNILDGLTSNYHGVNIPSLQSLTIEPTEFHLETHSPNTLAPTNLGSRARKNFYPSPYARVRPLQLRRSSPRQDRPTLQPTGDVASAQGPVPSRQVLYGPIRNVQDHKQSMAVMEETLSGMGLNVAMLHSVRPASEKPDHLSLQFFKDEDATRFVGLVSDSPEGHRVRKASFHKGMTDSEKFNAKFFDSAGMCRASELYTPLVAIGFGTSTHHPSAQYHRSAMGEPSVLNVNAHSVADNLGGNNASITAISRRRGRRPLTTESAQSAADSQVLVSLGMSPFMPGQDAVYNQNRFVRNEAILARRLSYLEQSYERAESDHTQMRTEIQSLLDDYKAVIDKLLADKGEDHTSTVPSALAALRQGYEEMCEAVHAILQHIYSASTSTQTGIQRPNRAARNARPEQVVRDISLSFSKSKPSLKRIMEKEGKHFGASFNTPGIIFYTPGEALPNAAHRELTAGSMRGTHLLVSRQDNTQMSPHSLESLPSGSYPPANFPTPDICRAAKRRGRKPISTTQEIVLPVSDAKEMISLGMSLPMPGQDMISNHNRVVRNEAILARRIRRLEQLLAKFDTSPTAWLDPNPRKTTHSSHSSSHHQRIMSRRMSDSPVTSSSPSSTRTNSGHTYSTDGEVPREPIRLHDTMTLPYAESDFVRMQSSDLENARSSVEHVTTLDSHSNLQSSMLGARYQSAGTLTSTTVSKPRSSRPWEL